MKHLAFTCLVLAACIDAQPATSTRSDGLASSVYPHQWTSRDVGMSAFWPTGATSVQVLITDGDRQNRQDTFYAWIIGDGRTVSTVWRVDKTNTAAFHTAMRAAFNEAESTVLARFDSITGSGGTGGPIIPPHIGPGGSGGGATSDGYFSQALVDDAVGAATSLRSTTLEWFDNNQKDGFSY